MTQKKFRLVLKKALKGVSLPPRAERRITRVTRARPVVGAQTAARALKATLGAEEIIAKIPSLAKAQLWRPTASFRVCGKTGTAAFLDIWDADHFDGFTDMQRCVSDCRAWFSADGFTYWDSPQTKTGRVNCYFRAPSDGNYVCNAQLQSYGGLAVVECLVDSMTFGFLPVTGLINQPHPCTLNAGYHSFRIRQISGSFFFLSLTVWKV